MKDKRFLELVNIYLDGEISDAETLELECEIRSSAERMDLYRRYCRMQKACLELARQSREATASAPGNTVRLPEANRGWAWGQWLRGGLYAGTGAIAATVILVISMSGPEQPSQVAIPDVNSGARIVQIPIGEFSRAKSAEPRLASLKDRWSTLTEWEASSFPSSIETQTPQFGQAPSVTEWTAVSILPERGPIEFRYRTDSISGERVLHARPRADDSEVEFATFQFAR